MTKQKKLPEDDIQNGEPTSSFGRDSRSTTPKDVKSSTAAAKDVTDRKIASDDKEERQEEQLDDAVEMTFPASDPIAIPDPSKIDKAQGNQRSS